MYANLIHCKFFILKIIELHHLLQDMVYIELSLIYFENFNFLDITENISIVQMWSNEGFEDTRVYSSTNWPLLTGGQNLILNWVLKLNLLNQKTKKEKLFRVLRESLIYSFFFTFRSHHRCKKSIQKKNYSPENEKCVHGRRLFLPYLFWIKLRRWFFKLSTFKTRPLTLVSMVNRGLEWRQKV